MGPAARHQPAHGAGQPQRPDRRRHPRGLELDGRRRPRERRTPLRGLPRRAAVRHDRRPRPTPTPARPPARGTGTRYRPSTRSISRAGVPRRSASRRPASSRPRRSTPRPCRSSSRSRWTAPRRSRSPTTRSRAAETVTAAVLQADRLTVRLTTSSLTLGTTYTVTVNNLRTASGVALPANLQTSFYYGNGILWEYWLNIGSGNAVADLTGNPNYPVQPQRTRILHALRGPHRLGGQLRRPDAGLYYADDHRRLLVLDRQRRQQRAVAFDRQRSRPQDPDRLGSLMDQLPRVDLVRAAEVGPDPFGGRAALLCRSPAEGRRRRRQPRRNLAAERSRLRRTAHRRQLPHPLHGDRQHPFGHAHGQRLDYGRYDPAAWRLRQRCERRDHRRFGRALLCRYAEHQHHVAPAGRGDPARPSRRDLRRGGLCDRHRGTDGVRRHHQ